MPRITGKTENEEDDSKEWARPGGHVPSTAVPPPPNSVTPSPEFMQNPIAFNTLLLTPSVDLKGDIVMGAVPAIESESYSAIADVQNSGFAYIQWDSEIKSDSNEGVVTLPLSMPRDILPAKLAVLGVSSGKECCVPVRLHAPTSNRVVSGTATRINQVPQIPDPLKQIVRKNGSIATNVETLVSKELLTENPVFLADQCTRQFTVSFRYIYSLSNPWAGDANEGGSNDIPWGIDPTIKPDENGNQIVVRGGSDSPLLYDSPTIYG